MLTDVASFLKFFEGVNRRAVRDVRSLPVDAETWKPPSGDGENAWSIGEIVGHMAASRMFFVSAYRGDGWVARRWPDPTFARDQWVSALQRSGDLVGEQLTGTPHLFLSRRVDSPDTPGVSLSGWRLLMMMVEHDVHHRSQIDTYAGIMGWPVEQIFGRSAEDVGLAG